MERSAAQQSSRLREIPYLFGIRAVFSLLIVNFHLTYMLLARPNVPTGGLYHTLTDWLRYGDFRVAAFFVISGYLLTLPTTRNPEWRLPKGVSGFFKRRVERLVLPYYVALLLSTVLYALWVPLAGFHLSVPHLFIGLAAHVVMLHNLSPLTAYYINDTLWNVALEFQCYLLFAFALLPIMRRYGPLAQLAFAALVGLGPHFLLHGFLDWTRPWLITLYAMGVAVAALRNPAFPRLTFFERAMPWGIVFMGFVVLAAVDVATGGMDVDVDYGREWVQNILLGVGVAALLAYTQTGMRGEAAIVIRPLVRFLSWSPLVRFGRYSYSTYLIHFPILRLLVELTARVTPNFTLQALLAFFVWVPITLVLAFRFHVAFERPFQRRDSNTGRPASHAAEVERSDGVALAEAPATA